MEWEAKRCMIAWCALEEVHTGLLNGPNCVRGCDESILQTENEGSFALAGFAPPSRRSPPSKILLLSRKAFKRSHLYAERLPQSALRSLGAGRHRLQGLPSEGFGR